MKLADIQQSIPEKHIDNVRIITHTLHESGFECHIVGGAVRDLLLGIPAFDFDFATNARPEQVMKLFRRVIPTGIKHGTVTVLFGKEPYEVTTYRSESTYTDGRRPDSVSFSDTLREDIVRRDFTINGLAYDIQHDRLIDYVGGIDDLKNGIIRTINDPMERLSEDGLRSYRACRFASRFDFEIEDATFTAITATLHISARVSAERVRDELMKIMATKRPSVGIEYLRECGLLALCLPELNAAYGVKQNRFHMFDVYYHCIYSCDAAPREDPLLRFVALLHDIGKVPCRAVGNDGDYTFYNHEIVGARMLKSIMRRLKFSNDETQSHVLLYKRVDRRSGPPLYQKGRA
ncbi:MAG: CCA tRNA nucleotidyltransferase [Spirochaetota bacterium]